MTITYHSDSDIADDALMEDIIAIDQTVASGFYPIGKLEAHVSNVRHKAISIFVFRDNKLLLQKRADKKYHSGGLWANTVCSHPRWNEASAECASRRLTEELGWTIPLRHFGQIDYAAQVGELFENEQVQCYFGYAGSEIDTIPFNPNEVSAIEWLSVTEIVERIKHKPELFTEWFKIYMSKHRTMIIDLLS
ncbi:MAG: NUDIX domain-containing protein [Granulosicoccus sp.]|nr:NUDIX domain-containing protein [Granulosicoccus sp.]